jgi:hypothetical protein
MKTNTFTMKDGRKITIDFTCSKSCLSVKKKDWKEIKKQFEDWIEIYCSKCSGSEVHRMFIKNKI